MKSVIIKFVKMKFIIVVFAIMKLVAIFALIFIRFDLDFNFFIMKYSIVNFVMMESAKMKFVIVEFAIREIYRIRSHFVRCILARELTRCGV